MSLDVGNDNEKEDDNYINEANQVQVIQKWANWKVVSKNISMMNSKPKSADVFRVLN